MTQKTLMIPLSALVWTLTLVALATALLITLGDASAQQPPISASIVDDTDQNTNSLCGGFVWSDGHCDLRIRITDHSATDSQATIVVSDIYSGAFDASVITPDDSALSSQALGPTPSTYTIPGNTRQIFRLRMTPVVTARGAQYYEGYVRVHHGAGTNGRQLAEYKLTLQAPTPTSVTSESITSTSFAVRWKMDERARRTIIFWRPRDGGSPEQSVQVTMVQNAKYRIISGLQPSTCYVARVQPLLDGKSLESAEIEVATLADPGATDPPADPCAPPPPPPPPPLPSPCTSSGDYDVDDDGLIEVSCLQQLDAIRHDLDGDGVPDINPAPPNEPADFTWGDRTEVYSTEEVSPGTSKGYWYKRGTFSDDQRRALYAAAFPSAEANMGCSEGVDPAPTPLCRGYELSVDLDFDENGNGERDDTYNTGEGWAPIMGRNYTRGAEDWFSRLYGGTGYMYGSTSAFNLAKMFRAVFEGNGRTISNLYINRPQGNEVGLFGWVAYGGVIRNLGLVDSAVRGSWQVGAIASVVDQASVMGSYTRSTTVSGRIEVGGLVGALMGGTVFESYVVGGAGGSVSGDMRVGGLIGFTNKQKWPGPCGDCPWRDSNVQYSFASVNVSSVGIFGAGGLIGYAVAGSPIRHTYASGAVTAQIGSFSNTKDWGALIGRLHTGRTDRNMIIDKSYATGLVEGHASGQAGGLQDHASGKTGGLIGGCLNLPVTAAWDSYWDVATTGQARSGCYRTTNSDGSLESLRDSAVGGKTTSELQTPTGPTGIYSTWGPVTVDGVSIPVWDFGTASEYPILVYCSAKPGIDLPPGKTEYCPLREATQHGRLYSPSP